VTPALTVKSQVTIPKPVRDYLGIGPGERIKFEPLPDGRVAISAATKRKGATDNPFAKFRGALKSGPGTDELLRMTRGVGWNRP
jgi:antitoxin PrlF